MGGGHHPICLFIHTLTASAAPAQRIGLTVSCKGCHFSHFLALIHCSIKIYIHERRMKLLMNCVHFWVLSTSKLNQFVEQSILVMMEV
ncbi:hypothetical protein MANES_16G106050v8 [Manihot esculenta]|uniref:Uncharacterized protein n=1 Tax=Manihot esculenta TaxID=3983 RepID=A0ACB7G7C8_MANES|nr:hypothetical protein MANES_16G106050v8 [Manihot esculenta]